MTSSDFALALRRLLPLWLVLPDGGLAAGRLLENSAPDHVWFA